ncbi:MAG TPA: hypothetical protein VNA89_04150 [Gemmatimonadaceae bacterium]|nr:hypothetical protein [Gemmatimonadaceae bacterium]
MMAPDSSFPPPDRLAAETVAVVRAALVRYMRDGRPGNDLHEALTAMAREARAKGIHAEHVLVTLKQLWTALPEVKATRDASVQAKLLQGLVTLCIDEYYAGE